MIPVPCEHCGEVLGYRDDSPSEIESIQDWQHTRCMTRVAKQWDMNPASVVAVRDLLAETIGVCYPDVAGNSASTKGLLLLRSQIAAESVLETLVRTGLRLVEYEGDIEEREK